MVKQVISPIVVRETRKSRKISQKELAANAGITTRSLSKIEKSYQERMEVHRKTFEGLQRALNIDPQVLCGKRKQTNSENTSSLQFELRGNNVLNMELVMANFGLSKEQVEFCMPMLFDFFARSALARMKEEFTEDTYRIRLEGNRSLQERYHVSSSEVDEFMKRRKQDLDAEDVMAPRSVGYLEEISNSSSARMVLEAWGEEDPGTDKNSDQISNNIGPSFPVLADTSPWWAEFWEKLYHHQNFSNVSLFESVGPSEYIYIADHGGHPSICKRELDYVAAGSKKAERGLVHGYIRLSEVPEELFAYEKTIERVKWLEERYEAVTSSRKNARSVREEEHWHFLEQVVGGNAKAEWFISQRHNHVVMEEKGAFYIGKDDNDQLLNQLQESREFRTKFIKICEVGYLQLRKKKNIKSTD
mgnify:CR=1 FL=1